MTIVPHSGAPVQGGSGPKTNPLRPMRRPRPGGNPLLPANRKVRRYPTPPAALVSAPSIQELRQKYGGWSQPPPDQVQVFPVFSTKRTLREGTRHHVMRFRRPMSQEDDKTIDPTDAERFIRPVTLQRRDTRQPPIGRFNAEAEEQAEASDTLSAMEDKEAERQAQIKAERDAQRAIDQAKIAPALKDASSKKPKKTKEEKPILNRAPKTEQGKKESELRYEESLPWHLEDAEGKNVWVGNYIGALSGAHAAVGVVAFVIDRPGFRMVTLEKCYKFESKPPFKPFSIDQAEAYMNKKTEVGRWTMREMEKKQAKEDMVATRRFLQPARVKSESDTFRNAPRSEQIEQDEIDMSGDEFQDDDEAPTFEPFENEEDKDAKARIRRDQLGANLFGEADELQVDKEEEDAQREEHNRKKLGKSLMKALVKRENDTRYESDSSDVDPFESSSSDDSSNEDDSDLDARADEDGKAAAKANVTEPAKNSPTSLTNKTKQQPDNPKKGKSLKRPSSPSFSDSGEREPAKKSPTATAATRDGQGQSGAPQGTAQLRRTQQLKSSAGSGSDADVPEGSPRKKIKLGAVQGRASQSASRAGSPNPAPRAAPTGVVEAWEIIKALPPPPGGLTIGNLMKPFQSRIGEGPGKMERKDWIKLVKANTVWGPDKLLRRKT